MATSSVTYTGDGTTLVYSVPFQYILAEHVQVYVDNALQATPANYTWPSTSSIQFKAAFAPGADAVVYIRRVTPLDSRLVTFIDGASLTEDDLNLNTDQLLYGVQEVIDAFNAILAGTYTDPSSTLLQSAVDSVLTTAAALEVQARITDIDTAGQLLLDAMMQRRVLGEPTDDYSAFILDTNTTMVSPTESLATRLTTITASYASNLAAILSEQTARADADTALASDITALYASVGTNSAAIATEASARASGDSANASDITALTSTVGGHTATLTTLASTDVTLAGGITTLNARYGVALNVDGFVSGFALNSTGTSSSFDILTSKFRVVDPGVGSGATPVSVFTIESGNVLLRNLYLDHLYLGASGAISAGKSSAADTANGIWFGTDGSTHYDLHMGDASSYLHWDGSAASLDVKGSINMTNSVQTFTPGWTGFSADPSGDISYLDFGAVVMLWSDSNLFGTSNANTFTITGLPSALQPTGIRLISCLVVDNSSIYNGSATLNNASSTISMSISAAFGASPNLVGPSGTSFSTSGSKGLPGGWLLTYPK